MELILGDCLEKMKDIPDGSIDMILCDLPYGTTACKWDVIIPFEPLWEQYKRIIKDRGAIVLFGSEPFSSYLRLSNMGQYKYDWVWVKSRPSGFVHAKNSPMKSHENIMIFSNGVINHESVSSNRMNYYPQDLIPFNKVTYRPNRDKNFTELIGHRPSHKKEIFQEHTGYPITVINFSNPNNNNFHPTQKPVALLEYLIKTYTLEGETILDNTMGSGSTGVACVNTNRNFIGIEKDETYFEIAQDRIKKAQQEKDSCLPIGGL